MRQTGASQNDDEKFNKFLYELAERNVRRTFILEEICDAESLEVTQEEIESLIEKEAQRANVSVDVVKKELVEKNLLDGVVGMWRQRKALDLVLSQAIIKEESNVE
jgi:FKBP-type peptidyl-prolyl cis-trans isomerase (trigger factor)